MEHKHIDKKQKTQSAAADWYSDSVVAFVCANVIWTVCISSNNKMIAAAGAGDYGITLAVEKEEERRKWKIVAALKGHTEPVTCLSFAGEHDKWLLSGSYDKTVILWDVMKREKAHVFRGHTGSIFHICLLSGHDVFVSCGGRETEIRFWSIAKTEQLGAVNTNEHPLCIGVRTDSKHLAVGHSSNNSVCIWDMSQCRSGSNAGDFNVTSIRKINTLSHHKQWVVTVCYSKDDRQFASGSYDGTIDIYSCENDTYSLTKSLESGDIAQIMFVDERHLLSRSRPGKVRLWGIEEQALVRNIHEENISSIALSRDSSLCVTGRGEEVVVSDKGIDYQALFGDIKNAAEA